MRTPRLRLLYPQALLALTELTDVPVHLANLDGAALFGVISSSSSHFKQRLAMPKKDDTIRRRLLPLTQKDSIQYVVSLATDPMY
eukprot:scaffold22635_cov134-Cylindrotheca_fusiformis.AAC.4